MDIRSCIIIKTIAEEKNITKAANKLFISQPSLTYTLKSIEEEFGATLFFRTPRGMELTIAGKALLKFANDSIIQYNDTIQKIKKIIDSDNNNLSIGVFSMYAHDEFQSILQEFLSKYPNVNIMLRTGVNNNIIQLLLNQEIDVAIIVNYDITNFDCYKLTDGKGYIAYNKHINISDLDKIPRVLYMPKSSNIQNHLDNWWSKNFTKSYNVSIGVDDFQLLYSMVKKGYGWASICNVNKAFLPKDLYFLPIENASIQVTYPICVTMNNSSTNLEYAKLFKNFIIKYYSSNI